MSLASQLTLAFAAVATAINGKAPKASPTFTGTVTVPTPTTGDNSTKAASTAFVTTSVSGVTAPITNSWTGSAWPSRPSGTTVIYDSTNDPTATAPTDMNSGDSWYQAAPAMNFKSKMVAWFSAPGDSNLLTATVGLVIAATGTATAALIAATNAFTKQRRVHLLVTTAATTAVAGWVEAHGNYMVSQGFIVSMRWGMATGSASNSTRRMFVGLTSILTAPADGDPSAVADCIGVGCDAADTNLQFMHRTASGTVVKSSTGMTKTVTDATEVWEMTLTVLPGATTGSMTLKRFSDGTVASYTTTTAIPASTTLLGLRGWASVGGTSSVVGFAIMNVYTEVA